MEKKIKFGIVVFPGSNCDHDAYFAVKKTLGFDAEFLWHKDSDLKNCDVIILPGGFSYGDYLRTGAIAKFSPIMKSVIEFANDGGYVIGICNGFQILIEDGLLPGMLLKNKSLKFVCKDVYLKAENNSSIFTKGIEPNKKLKLPVAHGDGSYFADDETLKVLLDNDQIAFRYTSKNGENDYNPNGSINDIAAITNKRKNVMGIMPHPERSCDPALGKTDGTLIFNSIKENILISENTLI